MVQKDKKDICYHREHYKIYDSEHGINNDVYPCLYMINYCKREYKGCFSDVLEPEEGFCKKCIFRNRDMGKDFEINPEIMKKTK